QPSEVLNLGGGNTYHDPRTTAKTLFAMTVFENPRYDSLHEIAQQMQSHGQKFVIFDRDTARTVLREGVSWPPSREELEQDFEIIHSRQFGPVAFQEERPWRSINWFCFNNLDDSPDNRDTYLLPIPINPPLS